VDEGVVAALERAMVEQWHHFGTGPGASWHEDEQLTWLEAPVAQLPYNGVFRTCLPDGVVAEERIGTLVDSFAARAVAHLWVVHPTAQPSSLAALLVSAGVPWVETAYGMERTLEDWSPGPPPAPDVAMVEVRDLQRMQDFESLSVDYWHLLPQTRRFVSAVNRSVGYGPDAAGVRVVAYLSGEPAGKAYLSFLGEPGTAAVFGVSVPERFRGHGIASALMDALMERARGGGYHRVVLHATEMAHDLYRRLGFRDVAPFEIHATTVLH
jgi:ribosomal protein S18 acetylase RimI-like enzyme